MGAIAMHARYGRYLARHKWFVLVAGLRVGAPLWRLLIHDWSKFLPCEWAPYVEFFYGTAPSGMPRDPLDRPNREANAAAAYARRVAAFDRAWLHHQHLNKHHWQHHVLRNDNGSTAALPMPERFIREMVADWMGAGRAITGRWDAQAWYARNRDAIVLHPQTRRRVEELLGAYGRGA